MTTVFGMPALFGGPRCDNHTVVMLPGWGTNDASTAPMRFYLQFLGYDVHGWGQGINRGDPNQAAAIGDRLKELADRSGRSLSLVGWSLGGRIAVDVARREPVLVHHVITLGSPLSKLSLGTVPITSVWSRNDGVVSWKRSQLRKTAVRQNVEVRATHLSLGYDPAVLHVIADRLTRYRAETFRNGQNYDPLGAVDRRP